MKIRGLLYFIAKIMGDVNAVRKQSIKRRVARRLAGKVTGRVFGKLFK